MRIGLLSDTHGYLDEAVYQHFGGCDEVWHAGDFGTAALAGQLAAFKPLRGVYGNIDGQDIRTDYPLHQRFVCEDMQVWITHIGGYPGRYNQAIRTEIYKNPPGLFICGHSHILKVQYDQKIKCLHLNPGAAGKQGWQKVRTLMRFSITGGKIHDLEVIELGKK